MDKLIYKSFTWPQNPDHYQQVYTREPVYEKNEAGETAFSGMGPKKLVITGSGAFFGSGAYNQFKTLIAVFTQPEAGALIHPQWGSLNCRFTLLQLTEEPRSDYVAYKFEFQEADSNGVIPK